MNSKDRRRRKKRHKAIWKKRIEKIDVLAKKCELYVWKKHQKLSLFKFQGLYCLLCLGKARDLTTVIIEGNIYCIENYLENYYRLKAFW